MLKTLLIIGIIIVIVVVIKLFIPRSNVAGNTSQSSTDQKPSVNKENDKLIIVKNVEHVQIQKALAAFCKMYNKNNDVLPRLTTLFANSFAVTFPYDIDIATFSFAVNYLDYPTDIEWNADVHGWATTKNNDDFTTEKSRNKHVMFYMAADDKEYDNIFMTTDDNIGYRVSFAGMSRPKEVTVPSERYKVPPVTNKELEGLKFEDFNNL